MAVIDTLDFDNLEDGELVDLAEAVREQWAERDEAIADAVELRRQDWTVPVPEAWKQTAETRHTSLAREIPARVPGTMSLSEPQFRRPYMDDDVAVAERAESIERFHSGLFQHFKRKSIAGKNGYFFAMDQLVNKGAVCIGDLFAPHAYWSVPGYSEHGSARLEWWRDAKGRPTESEDEVDESATARAYLHAVDQYRRTACPPITRRVVPTEQAYPLFLEGRQHALFIFRRAAPLELLAGGFQLKDAPSGAGVLTESRDFLEVVTPNRIRYFAGRDALPHSAYGSEGVVTNYGFIPFTYKVGLEGGELEYGSYGLPLLGLVSSQLRLITTLLTYIFNAVHLASFPSFQLEYLNRDGTATASNTLPAIQMVAEAIQTITEAIAASSAWVLNLRNQGLTEYTNWAFNSLAYFNGKYLGAGEGGIFELGVQDHEDDTADIPARFRTGKHDMDSSFLKRMPYGYLECEADGDVTVSTLTSEDGQRDYLVPWNGNTEVQNRRVNFGRGPKSKHWQFEFANRDGSHFRIVALDSMPRRSHRRVQ